jgi:GTP-binding protein
MTASLQEVVFLGSYPESKLIPDSNLPEFGFWGRSNVGKSSLINYLCSRKDLARTSSTPGKTREFNVYKIDNAFQIMDLPGYGYARVSKTRKELWDKEIQKYLINRKNMVLLFLLIDISIEPQKIDIQKINWLGEKGIPFYVLFTKSDKCKAAERKRHKLELQHHLKEFWEILPVQLDTSSKNMEGKESVLNAIYNIIK